MLHLGASFATCVSYEHCGDTQMDRFAEEENSFVVKIRGGETL